MIILCGLDSFNADKSLKGDFNFLIARRLMSKSLTRTFSHLPQVAPSEDLLQFALMSKKAKLPWIETYTSRYIREMQQPLARATIMQLVSYAKAGKNITLVCYCPKGEFCHRFLLAKILKQVAKDIEIIVK